jgi:hypothetical protein
LDLCRSTCNCKTCWTSWWTCCLTDLCFWDIINEVRYLPNPFRVHRTF